MCNVAVNDIRLNRFKRNWFIVIFANPAIDVSRKSPQHIHTPSNKELLSLRTIKHSEFLLKTEYIVLNFYSNFGRYEHNLLAYERDPRGANCAHEHGLSINVGYITLNIGFAEGLSHLIKI